MNTFKNYFLLMALTLGLTVTSCVDNDFDQPQNTFQINDANVMTIAEVLALLNPSAAVDLTEANIGEEPMYIRATLNVHKN